MIQRWLLLSLLLMTGLGLCSAADTTIPGRDNATAAWVKGPDGRWHYRQQTGDKRIIRQEPTLLSLEEGVQVEQVLPGGLVIAVDAAGERRMIDPHAPEQAEQRPADDEDPAAAWTLRSTELPPYAIDLIGLERRDLLDPEEQEQEQNDDGRRGRGGRQQDQTRSSDRESLSRQFRLNQSAGFGQDEDDEDNRRSGMGQGGGLSQQMIPSATRSHLGRNHAYPASRPEQQTLQAGDAVRIVTWGGVTLNDTFRITPEGSLAVPGFGAIPVAGMRRLEAQQAITELLRSHYKNAGVLLNVEQAAIMGVTVLGEVAEPGLQLVPANASLLACLRAAGGPLRRGSLRRISVTEPGSDSRVIDLYALAAGETAEPLQSLRPQSVIMVPLAGPHVQVFGEVRRSYTFELAPEASLAQVLELAGGLTSAADPDRIRLLREDRHGQDLQLLAMAQLAEVTVRDGDRLHIGRKASLDNSYNSVRVEGQVRSGGTYPIAADMTLSEALRLAGGMTPKADVEKIFIIRNLTEPAQLQLNDDVDLAVYQDLVTNAKPDTVLLPLDTIVVPAKPELSRATLTVQINGAIQHPGYYPLLPEMNAADLIRMAGGVRASAQVDEADLIRLKRIGEARTVERMAVDLRPILNDQTEGPLLRNGDTLVVRSTSEERISVSLEGEITNTGEFVFPAGTTLGQALAIAGGLTEWAFPAGARFFRASEAEVAEEQLDNLMRQLQQSKAVNESLLNNATDPSGRAALERTIVNQQIELERMQRAQATGRMTGVDVRGILALAPGTDFTLQEGDRLSIPMRPGTIRVLGEVMTPGSLRFEEGLQVRDVVRRAGGMSQQADEDRVFVIRADGTVVASAAYSGTAWDPAERRWVRTDIERITLLEGDTVLVPPDLEYRISGMQLAKDWSQILFQVAATVGTIAVIGN